MPDFRLNVSAPSLGRPVWEDPASATRPSRITGLNDRQHRKVVVDPGETVTLSAILDGETIVQDDLTVGLFTMWPIEWPTGSGQPAQDLVVPGTSAEQTFRLDAIGHYTLACRHENYGGAPGSAAGGVIVVHIEVEG